ncbi:hypothetical protein EYF80_006906 [Liparis tanakae]|uniref:Uncharacterized protein n=1 Tax=Liparis tanakae TaxID=230148 RepID=A0A4Z2IY92_9TELE|nr:hypothetical protein EYF80_006906 [Liparis tanakae]
MQDLLRQWGNTAERCSLCCQQACKEEEGERARIGGGGVKREREQTMSFCSGGNAAVNFAAARKHIPSNQEAQSSECREVFLLSGAEFAMPSGTHLWRYSCPAQRITGMLGAPVIRPPPPSSTHTLSPTKKVIRLMTGCSGEQRQGCRDAQAARLRPYCSRSRLIHSVQLLVACWNMP